MDCRSARAPTEFLFHEIAPLVTRRFHLSSRCLYFACAVKFEQGGGRFAQRSIRERDHYSTTIIRQPVRVDTGGDPPRPVRKLKEPTVSGRLLFGASQLQGWGFQYLTLWSPSSIIRVPILAKRACLRDGHRTPEAAPRPAIIN